MSIDALIIALGGVPPLVIEEVGAAATEQAILGVDAAITALDGKSASVTITAEDLASSVIGGVEGALNALNGRVAETTIRTIYENRGIGPGQMLGGVVQPYQMGGVVIRAGEAGPEMAHFATGGTALIPGDGIYSVPAGTYISPNNATGNSYGGVNVTVNVGGSVVAERELTYTIVSAIADAMAVEAFQVRAGYGEVA